jgi:hypothetical protein
LTCKPFFGKFKDEIGDINRFETAGELIEELYHHARRKAVLSLEKASSMGERSGE